MHRWDGPQSYCGYYENKASVLIIDRGNLSLKQYEETEPPYRLPDNLDVFSWSVPFLAEKVTNMLYNILKKGGIDAIEENGEIEKILKRDDLDEK